MPTTTVNKVGAGISGNTLRRLQYCKLYLSFSLSYNNATYIRKLLKDSAINDARFNSIVPSLVQGLVETLILTENIGRR